MNVICSKNIFDHLLQQFIYIVKNYCFFRYRYLHRKLLLNLSFRLKLLLRQNITVPYIYNSFLFFIMTFIIVNSFLPLKEIASPYLWNRTNDIDPSLSSLYQTRSAFFYLIQEEEFGLKKNSRTLIHVPYFRNSKQKVFRN